MRGAEVSKQRPPARFEQDICWLDVGVYESMSVHRLERRGDGDDHTNDFGDLERATCRDGLFERRRGERHHEPRFAGGRGLDEIDDVRMAQAPQHLDLAP